jgi:NAD(P)-dependent dehydrogenase (short-subunit alcohol dehydrogenase family)
LIEGKVALITGGGTGIGRAAAELFAAHGARVVIAGRRAEPLQSVAAASAGRITFVTMDLTARQDRARALAEVVARHDRLDILVNNAAALASAEFMELTDEDIANVVHTNLISTALMIKEAVPHLRKTAGNIVNISSAAAHHVSVPSNCLSIYSASKAGLNQLTRALAPELGRLGIRINCVAPGFTDTDLAAPAVRDPAVCAMLVAQTPLGRLGQPQDVAQSILFMAGARAGWVTGQVLDASGGHWL